MSVDLHTHSRYSDGLDDPAVLAKKAAAAGLSALALTDHDTVQGVSALREAAAALGVRVIPGVEFDTDFTPGTLHMLGYFIRPEDPGLCAALDRLAEGRSRRLTLMIHAMKTLGITMDEAEIRSRAGEGSIGRPHMARYLLAHGVVASQEEAFARYLAEGRPGYVRRYTESPEQAIRRIRDAGGVAVLAHPKTLHLSAVELEKTVERLCAEGLGGIEVFYPDHNPVERRRFLRLARRWNLASTGGSDYHGDQPGRPGLGTGYGTLAVPDSLIADLEARCVN